LKRSHVGEEVVEYRRATAEHTVAAQQSRVLLLWSEVEVGREDLQDECDMVIRVPRCAERIEASPCHLEDFSVADVLWREASGGIASIRDDVLVNRWLRKTPSLALSEDVDNPSLMVAVTMREEDGRERGRVGGWEDDIEEVFNIPG
jgi:hypothetical protein